MKNALMAVAITALMGGLVIAPVTQQSAEAQVYGGLKSTSAPAGSELLTLVAIAAVAVTSAAAIWVAAIHDQYGHVVPYGLVADLRQACRA
jgi:hypothetical protein